MTIISLESRINYIFHFFQLIFQMIHQTFWLIWLKNLWLKSLWFKNLWHPLLLIGQTMKMKTPMTLLPTAWRIWRLMRSSSRQETTTAVRKGLELTTTDGMMS